MFGDVKIETCNRDNVQDGLIKKKEKNPQSSDTVIRFEKVMQRDWIKM